MKPLNPFLLDATSPSRWESRLQKIPILGWIFAHAMFQDRIKSIVKNIKEQVKVRDKLDVRLYWTEDDWPIALKLFDIVRDTMGWNPCLFIPEDPCRIVFWSYIDCMDGVEARRMIEDEFKLKFTDNEITQIEQFTMLELVHLIRKQSNKSLLPTATSPTISNHKLPCRAAAE